MQAQRDQFTADLRKRVERARTWPQFKEHETEISTFMDAERAKGNFVRFEDAYMQIVIPKLAGDRTKIRQELVTEMNALPKTSSTVATGAPKHDENKAKTTADIAREIMAQMG